MVASRSRSDYEITCLFETRSILEMNITRKLISEYLENSTRSGRNFHDGSSTNFISSFHNFPLIFRPFFWNTLIRTIILHVIRCIAQLFTYFSLIATATFPLLSLSPAAQVENCWKRRDAAPFRPRQLFYIYRLWLRFGRNWCWKMIGLKSYVFYSRDKVSWEEWVIFRFEVFRFEFENIRWEI